MATKSNSLFLWLTLVKNCHHYPNWLREYTKHWSEWPENPAKQLLLLWLATTYICWWWWWWIQIKSSRESEKLSLRFPFSCFVDFQESRPVFCVCVCCRRQQWQCQGRKKRESCCCCCNWAAPFLNYSSWFAHVAAVLTAVAAASLFFIFTAINSVVLKESRQSKKKSNFKK